MSSFLGGTLSEEKEEERDSGAIGPEATRGLCVAYWHLHKDGV